MKFTFTTDEFTRIKADVIGLLVFEDRPTDGAAWQSLDRALDGLLGRLAVEERFKGKKGQSLTLHTHARIGPSRILVVGAGARKEWGAPDLRGFAARVVKAAQSAGGKVCALAHPFTEGTVQERAAQFVAEGVLLGGYRFERHLSDEAKKNREPASVEEVKIVVAAESADPALLEGLARGVARGEQVAAGVALARDLVNEPAGTMTPKELADVARRVAREHGLEIKVLGPRECEKLGMGMFLGVAQGSVEEPRLIHLTYRPRGKAPPKKRIALVGKGITFDSGGLSLKPTDGMLTMKVDMAGGAAVIAAISVLADLNAPCEVHAVCAACENMPSGTAYKLGDVLRAMSGKTVEINNTDAEGRLTLGDAMTYALREAKPDELFDFATLTGACMVALGPHIAGVMSNDLSLVERWLAAARLAGEEMWQLPLPERLKEQLKSDVADMKNTGDRYGGALTAGLFLKEFAGETPWVHVDLAGPANADKEFAHIAKGGTGFGVATIVEYLATRD